MKYTEIIWDEHRFRKELTRLDGLTGLHGAKLPIKFGNAKRTLGMFSSQDGGSFTFSNYWFQNPDWPVQCALDVIRHEYAHYMDWELYGNLAHGATWKKCCLKVGAIPTRLYRDEFGRYYAKKHEKEDALSHRYGRYQEGMMIHHPKFGIGMITSVEGEGMGLIALVTFDNTGNKRLGIAWIDQNCTDISEEDTEEHP